jgi:hypothetical protein
MAAFPPLAPSAAPITPGAWPVSAISSLNGAESRIRQGSAQIDRRLQLTFPNVTEANFLAILNHYRGQRSGFDSFGFDPTTLAADLTPAGYAWLYTSHPQVVDEHADVFTVVCEFKAEPRGLVVALGKAWRSAQTSLTRNVAPGVQWVNGQSSFLPGTGARFAAGVRWETSTVFAPQSSSMGVAWATSSTTFLPGNGLSLAAGAQWVTTSTAFTQQGVNKGKAWSTSTTTLSPGARSASSGGSSGGTGAAFAFTGGTSVAFDINEEYYGFVFTLSTAKTVAGFGIYNPAQVTMNNSYVFSVFQVATLAPFATTGGQINQAASILPGSYQEGNTAFFDGSWRRIDVGSQFTLQPGTYVLLARNDYSGFSDTIVKNATGVTAASGVAFVQNLAYLTGGDNATIPAAGTAYFGPMIFFQ